MRQLVVFLAVIYAFGGSSAFDDNEEKLWDRFRLWFHAMDHNGDCMLSPEDYADCLEEYTAKATGNDLATAEIKCGTTIPAFYKYFIFRGHDSPSESQFIDTFQAIYENDRDRFEKLIYTTADVLWRSVDLNGDDQITEDEDACVEGPGKDVDVLAVMFAQYLIFGNPWRDPDTVDPACPWMY